MYLTDEVFHHRQLGAPNLANAPTDLLSWQHFDGVLTLSRECPNRKDHSLLPSTGRGTSLSVGPHALAIRRQRSRHYLACYTSRYCLGARGFTGDRDVSKPSKISQNNQVSQPSFHQSTGQKASGQWPRRLSFSFHQGLLPDCSFLTCPLGACEILRSKIHPQLPSSQER